jgi:hypothetical protein
LGIDLASQPKETAACLIEWLPTGGRVIDRPNDALTDDVLVDLILDERVSKVGIDAPFGWPVAFIDAIASYRDQGMWLDLEPNEIRFRATDIFVWDQTKRAPLSVAMDDLAWPAMRCARILSRMAGEHGVLDRTGQGRVAEVYPMAALRRWEVISLDTPPQEWSYKGHGPGRGERRAQHFAKLCELLDGSVAMSDEFAELCVADDDDFDAFVSALVARATELSQTDTIPRGMHWQALREGWIQLPSPDSVGQLATT